MNPKRVFPILTVAAACAAGAVPVASAKAADVQQASSGNWSGYVVGSSSSSSARTFKTVTGSWVQPTAKCSAASSSTYSAFWVGLGGATGKESLEQDGTEVNCSATGKATYYAWYELVPKAPVKVDVAVHPGDHMTATTAVNGHHVTETIVNRTTGASFTKTLYMSNPDLSSAEWVAEAPSQCQGSVNNCSALPLSDFGKVTFSGASATDSTGHTGTIGDSDWQTARLTLSSSADSASGVPGDIGYGGPSTSSSAGATASKLSNGGSTFSVAYKKNGTSTSTSSSTGTGYGYGASGGYGSVGATSGYGYGYGSGYGYGYGSTSGYGSGGGYGYGQDTYGAGSGYGGYSVYGYGANAGGGYPY